MHSPFIGAYWAARQETRSHCAQRVAGFLERIAQFSELSRWYEKGKSAIAASKSSIPVYAEEIETHLRSNSRDIDGSVIAELGYSLNIWNGDSVSISITCGAFAPSIRNFVLLKFPSFLELAEEKRAEFHSVLRSCIDVWDPAVAIATSRELIAQEGGGMPWQTRGWMGYRKGESISVHL